MGDLARAAKLLAEIRAGAVGGALEGVEAAEAQEPWLQEREEGVRAAALALLARGLRESSQPDVGAALQVFFNLGDLQGAVQGVMADQATAVGRELDAALARPRGVARGEGGGGAGGRGGGGGSGEGVWAGLEAGARAARAAVRSVALLQAVLAKKRDPLSHTLFLEEAVCSGAPPPAEQFWHVLCGAVAAKLNAVFHRASPVKEELVRNYLRLAALLEGLMDGVEQDALAGQGGGSTPRPAIPPGGREKMHRAAEVFQAGYLTRAFGHLNEAVSYTFGSRNVPNRAETRAMLARLLEGLQPPEGGVPAPVALLLVGNVAKALKAVADRARAVAASGPELRGIGRGCSQAQARNIALCLRLQEVHGTFQAVLPRVPAAGQEALQGSLNLVERAARRAVEPILRAAQEQLGDALQRMAAERWDAPAAADGTVASSTFLPVFAASLGHFHEEFIMRLLHESDGETPETSFVVAMVAGLGAGLAAGFIRHAALLRPLGEQGTLRLAKTGAEFEAALRENTLPAEQLGRAHRALRALRRLVVTPTADLAGGSALVRELPVVDVLHHLYSRAPNEVRGPQARAGLTPAQYSAWIDQHSEAEAVAGVEASLEGLGQEAAQSEAVQAMRAVIKDWELRGGRRE